MSTTGNQPRGIIPTVDLSPLFTTDSAETEKTAAGRALVAACHNLGFVILKGHGLSAREIHEAFTWTRKLFALSEEEKMKAPHPEGNMPHRGYSGIGKEKVYSPEDLGSNSAEEGNENVGEELRKISDFKVFSFLSSYLLKSKVAKDGDNNRKATKLEASTMISSKISGFPRISSPDFAATLPHYMNDSPAWRALFSVRLVLVLAVMMTKLPMLR